MPTVDRYMTRQPWIISSRSSLADASAVMRAHEIRHLPVVDEGKLVGILSDRDLRLFASIGNRAAHVHDAMTETVFAVTAGEAVDDVARMMSERKYGSAVVMTSGGAVEGIFTAVDACRALAEVLERATC